MKLERILVYLLFYTAPSLFAGIGCMDDSWHLARPFDAKEYHFVKCYCPCRKISLARGECLDCGHKHDIQPMYIIKRPTSRVKKF